VSTARARWKLTREVLSYFVGVAAMGYEVRFDHFHNPTVFGAGMVIAGFTAYRNGKGHE
jgi:hypothetical protein